MKQVDAMNNERRTAHNQHITNLASSRHMQQTDSFNVWIFAC